MAPLTDLFENWNRYYFPDIGRYLSPEPMLQKPLYPKLMAQSGMATPTYAYASNNPVGFTDPTGLTLEDGASGGPPYPGPGGLSGSPHRDYGSPDSVDWMCWAKCIEQTDPLNDNSDNNQCRSNFWTHAAPLALGPLPKWPGWYQPGASPFTSIWRYLNIGSRAVSGSPVISGPATKTLGRGGAAVALGAGAVEWGVILACRIQCSL